jgi:pentatricopeptide repeat protein
MWQRSLGQTSSHAAAQQITSLCRQGQVLQAFEVFKKLEISSELPYNAMLNGFVDSDHFSKAVQLFRDMEKCFQPDVSTYCILARGISRNLHQPGTRELLNSLFVKSNPADKRNLFIANTILSGYVKDQQLEIAEKFLQVMKSDGIVPNVVSYNILISGYAKDGNMKRARTWFERLKKAELVPTDSTFNTLINGFMNDRDLENAMEMFSQMKSSGIKPNQKTFAILIDGAFKNGDFERALSIAQEMKELGVVADDFIRNVLINGLSKAGLVNRADEVLASLNQTSSTTAAPDLISYGTVMAAYNREKNYSRVVKLYEEMQAKGIALDDTAYCIVMNAFAKLRAMENALQVLAQMKTSGVRPESKIYACLIDGFVKQGDLEKACQMFSELRRSGCQLTAVSFNSLMNGFVRARNFEKARGVYALMLRCRVQPTVFTYSILITMMMEQTDLDGAFAIFEEHSKSSTFTPLPSGNISALVQAHLEAGGHEERIKVLMQALEKTQHARHAKSNLLKSLSEKKKIGPIMEPFLSQ